MKFGKAILGIVALAGVPAMTAQAAVVIDVEDKTLTVDEGTNLLDGLDVFFSQGDAGNENLDSFNYEIEVRSIGSAPALTLRASTLPSSTNPFVFGTVPPASFTAVLPSNTGEVRTVGASGSGAPNPETGTAVGDDIDAGDGLGRVNFTFAPASAGTYQYTFTVGSVSGLTDNQFGDITRGPSEVSTLTINVVPEPASLGLLAVGGLLALRRRRVN